GTPSRPDQSNKVEQHTGFVTIHWLTNIHCIPIDYAFRPRLRGRLTLRRLTYAGTLGLSATLSFTVFVVTHASIRTSDTSRRSHESPFAGLQNAPLPRISCDMHPKL